MILITGGLGYIGPQLISELNSDPDFSEHKIVVFDSLRGRFDYYGNPNRSYKVFRNLKEKYPDIELEIGDIRYKTDQLSSLVSDADYVFHLAAVTGASYSNDNRKLYWETIFDGTMNIFEKVRNTGIEKFVNISSCNVYGRTPDKQLDEESDINPVNAYAKAKASAEKTISDRFSSEEVSAVSLRLATNFGCQNPEFGGTRYNLVVNKFVKQAMENKPLTPYGDGENWRPYIHVSDSARLIKEISKAKINSGEVFNAGFNGMNFQIKEIAEKVKNIVEEKTDYNVEIDYMKNEDPGPSYRVDFSRLQDKISLNKEVSMEEGIRGLIENYENGEEVREKWNP